MGSQSLEILRQGIWASLTGGWFYDPHLDSFSNIFHLYVWLFLLCLPFTIYLFFPPTFYVWFAYCVSIVTLFGTIKFVNHALHNVYDTKECLEEPGPCICQNKSKRASRNNKCHDKCQDQVDLGIELQVLNNNNNNKTADTPPVECSSRNSFIEQQNGDADSITSEYNRQKPNSTIDLKVEIHRKNSSESSEETLQQQQLNKPSSPPLPPPPLPAELVVTNGQDYEPKLRNKMNEWRLKRQKCVMIAEEDRSGSRKLCRHASEDASQQQTTRHGLGGSGRIKQTSSCELEQHNNEQDYPYWKSNQSVRRLASNSNPMDNHLTTHHPQSLEIISNNNDNDNFKIPSHPQSLEVIAKNLHQQLVHPQSLETIGGTTSKNIASSDDNNLPLYPTSLETINTKKILPQNTLKRNQLQLLPYLSYGSEIVHPIAEQSDEQFTNESSGAGAGYSLRDSYSPLLDKRIIIESGGGGGNYQERFNNFNDDSTNSREALIDAHIIKSSYKKKRRLSNASQSSHELSCDIDRRRKDEKEEEEEEESCKFDESIVGIDWLFKNNDYPKNYHGIEPDSGSSSTTTLSIDNEVKRTLLPQQPTIIIDSAKRHHQGAIPKQNRPKLITDGLNDIKSSSSSSSMKICHLPESLPSTTTTTDNELSILLQKQQVPGLLGPLIKTETVGVPPAGLSRRHRPRRLKRHHRVHRGPRHHHQQQQQQSLPGGGENNFTPIAALLGLISNGECHIATNHNDTSEGAVHCFRDDNGRWLAYTFDEKGSGIATAAQIPTGHSEKLINTLLRKQQNGNNNNDGNWELGESLNNSYSSLSLNSAGLTVIIDTPSSQQQLPVLLSNKLQNSSNILSTTNNNNNNNNNNSGGILDQGMMLERDLFFRMIAERNSRIHNLLGNNNNNNNNNNNGQQLNTIPIQLHHNQHNQQEATAADVNTSLSWNRFIDGLDGPNDANNKIKKQTRHYYKWKIGKMPSIKIRFDRLSLLALLDRNLSTIEIIISILLALFVAGLGLELLQGGFYRDIFAFFFCFVTAGCQYSLLKSVQPDAASPTHGFNRIIVFSRPVYYIIVSTIIIILNKLLKANNFNNSETLLVYGFRIADYDTITQIRNILLIFLLSFPILFSLGLFPQINTFLMYICEHLDIHLFGGTATTSLISSIYCLSRSIITVAILYGFVYGALTEPKSSQHILFSIFAGLLVAVSYHLSRLSSDPSVIWDILKTNIWPPDIYMEQEKNQKKDQECEAKIIENTSTSNNNNGRRRKKTSKIQEKKHLNHVKIKIDDELSDLELIDPLPNKLRSTVKARLKNDLIVCCIIGVLSFTIHYSTFLTALQPELNPVLWGIVSCLGFLIHYILPQLRKQLPWLCLSRPVLKSYEYGQFEVREQVKIMWFERVYVFLCFIERNILYPIIFLSSLNECSLIIIDKYGESIGGLIIVICGFKSLRSSYCDSSSRYLVLIFSILLFQYDLKKKNISETFLIDYFITSIIYSKINELLLKLKFIVTYIAPWQVTWGSAFHAFAQPFSVPHSAMLFLQAIISSILSTPLNPLLGSAIFICSYIRPIKFWERDYNTKRVDNSNTRMSSHLERNLGADDNNLNSIFYEQLTRSLQHSLYGDLQLGRWGLIEQGDCFLLASDYLNCLVHIIQFGNGLVTFQLRGLEFRGTYCQQREVEAISESIEDNDNCCCCELGHFTNILSINAAFGQRWLAWEIANSKYVLEGYSISDNSAVSMLQVFDFRKVLVTYYVKSIIYYAIKSNKLKQWIINTEILNTLKLTLDKNFVDLDPVFNMNIDQDFDFRSSGITRNSFCNIYLDWIQYCLIKTKNLTIIDKGRDSTIVSLCLSLSLLGRRVLGAASHNTVSSVEFFLYGLHALFKGDFRITSVRDEWVLHDIDLLKYVVAKGVRMALKLHQDHFMSPEQYEESSALYEAIDNHDKHLVISHEADPLWRNAVLSGAPSLLALRHILDDGIDEYKVIMLNKRYLSFRVIKMNRECVRGLWAGQQQELIYLRNRNPERGSIQNAKQALRNIINSSCDQPIGYPIYVSPLTTSYAETNQQLSSIIGGPITLNAIKLNILKFWRKMRRKCGQGCSSGATSGGSQDDGGFGNDGVYAMTTYNIHSSYSGHNTSASQSMDSGCQIGGGGGSTTGRGSLGRTTNTGSLGGGKPTSSTLASLAGLLSNNNNNNETTTTTSFTNKPTTTNDNIKEDLSQQQQQQRVRIMDPNQVYDAINLGRRIDVLWPDERMRLMGGRLGWQHWVPERGMEGCVVHRWIPNHRDSNRRSHVDKVILLVKIDDKYVPIAEQGVRDLGAEV